MAGTRAATARTPDANTNTVERSASQVASLVSLAGIPASSAARATIRVTLSARKPGDPAAVLTVIQHRAALLAQATRAQVPQGQSAEMPADAAKRVANQHQASLKQRQEVAHAKACLGDVLRYKKAILQRRQRATQALVNAAVAQLQASKAHLQAGQGLQRALTEFKLASLPW